MFQQRLKSKLVIVINGKGGCGKDTLVEIAECHYRVWNRSAITPIKEIALEQGWDSNDKSPQARKFLSDLKRVFIDFNDLPTNYLINEHDDFLGSQIDILFVHIREPDQIDSFIDACGHESNGHCNIIRTLLVKNPRMEEQGEYGNTSDDDVDNYKYDYTYINDKSIQEMPSDVTKFLYNMLTNEGLI